MSKSAKLTGILAFALGMLIVGGWTMSGCGISEDQQQKIVSKFIDSDNDGLTDNDEIMKYHTGLASRDTDGDGLIDGDEVNKYGTDPLDWDTDDDGYSDGQEVNCGYDPLNNGNPGNVDSDYDGLNDINECIYNCDPNNPDTDGDHWNDWAEAYYYGTGCRDSNSYPGLPRVLINEVYNGGFNPLAIMTSATWVELYNPEDYAVDITWWQLCVQTDVSWGSVWCDYLVDWIQELIEDQPLMIEPGQYLVLDFTNGILNTTDHKYYQYDYPFSFCDSLGDSGSVYLLNDNGVSVDFLRWGSNGSWPITYPGAAWYEETGLTYNCGQYLTLSRDTESTDTDWDRDWQLWFPTQGSLASLDADGDLLPDALEQLLGTDPNDPDTDGDGWDDGFEVFHGTDPLDPNDPNPADADGDGYPNAVDCKPLDYYINPGRIEICNGIDDNCNQAVDEGCDPGSDGVILQGNYLKLGINPDNSLITNQTQTGIQYDSAGTGANWTSDWIYPGSPYEFWSVTYNGTLLTNARMSGPSDIPMSLMNQSQGSTLRAAGAGKTPDGNIIITQIVEFTKGSKYAMFTVTFENPSLLPLMNFAYLRGVDPDMDSYISGSATYNDVMFDSTAYFPALVLATGPSSNYTLGLGSLDATARASNIGWSEYDPLWVWNNQYDPNGSENDTINALAHNLVSLPGYSAITITFYYVVGDNPTDAQANFIYIGDSDHDGMPDEWEIANGLDPENPLDAILDPDSDGLPNLTEYYLGTNPNDADTDDDGLTDYEEINATYGYYTLPTVADTDGDGISDGQEELTFLTNPLLTDTDLDGRSDYQEICYDGNCATYVPGVDTDPNIADTDGDGFGDGSEVTWGSDPLNPASIPSHYCDVGVKIGTVPIGSSIYQFFENPPDFDLAHGKICFVPDGFGGYVVYSGPHVFPSIPIAGTPILDCDDCNESIALSSPFPFYGIPFPTVYVDSNGYVNFLPSPLGTTGDNSPDSGNFLGETRLAMFWNDLDPSDSGTVSFEDRADRLVLTYENVTESLGSNSNSFQAELIYATGEIMITFGDVDAVYGLVGISPGIAATDNPTDFNPDADSDGLEAWGEITAGTDPNNPDSDGDGMPDGWEVHNGLDPLDPADASLDPDSDGLTSLEEYGLGTDPQDSDTDNDGLLDGDEVNEFSTDPLDNDSDDDGMTDGLEVCYDLDCDNYTPGSDTDPNDSDTDGDYWSDGSEVSHGWDPLSNASPGYSPSCNGGCTLWTVNGTARLFDTLPRTDTTSYSTARSNCLALGGDMINFDELWAWQHNVYTVSSADIAYYSYEDATFCAAHPGEWGSAPTCCGMIGDGFGWDDYVDCTCHDCDDGNNYALDVFSNSNNGGYACVWR
ncbi:MAG: MopE-related protein [bacterium]|nr:MopE-related protein [bacterium]